MATMAFHASSDKLGVNTGARTTCSHFTRSFVCHQKHPPKYKKQRVSGKKWGKGERGEIERREKVRGDLRRSCFDAFEVNRSSEWRADSESLVHL